MIYKKLKRTWSNGYAHYIPQFRKTFPELNKIDDEEMYQRFVSLNMEFYHEEQVSVSPIIRLTLPFGLIVLVLMFLSLPIHFMITGQWGYSLGDRNKIYNWFKSLRLQ